MSLEKKRTISSAIIPIELRKAITLHPDDILIYELTITAIRTKYPKTAAPTKRPTTIKEWKDYLALITPKTEKKADGKKISTPKTLDELGEMVGPQIINLLAIAHITEQRRKSKNEKFPPTAYDYVSHVLASFGTRIESTRKVRAYVSAKLTITIRDQVSEVARTTSSILFDDPTPQNDEVLRICLTKDIKVAEAASVKLNENLNDIASIYSLHFPFYEVIFKKIECLTKAKNKVDYENTIAALKGIYTAINRGLGDLSLTKLPMEPAIKYLRTNLSEDELGQQNMAMIVLAYIGWYCAGEVEATTIEEIEALPNHKAEVRGRKISIIPKYEEPEDGDEDENEDDNREKKRDEDGGLLN